MLPIDAPSRRDFEGWLIATPQFPTGDPIRDFIFRISSELHDVLEKLSEQTGVPIDAYAAMPELLDGLEIVFKSLLSMPGQDAMRCIGSLERTPTNNTNTNNFWSNKRTQTRELKKNTLITPFIKLFREEHLITEHAPNTLINHTYKQHHCDIPLALVQAFEKSPTVRTLLQARGFPLYETGDASLAGHTIRSFSHIPYTHDRQHSAISYTALSLQLSMKRPIDLSQLCGTIATTRVPNDARKIIPTILARYRNLVSSRSLQGPKKEVPFEEPLLSARIHRKYTPQGVWMEECGVGKLSPKDMHHVYCIACGLLCWDNRYHTPTAIDGVSIDQYARSLRILQSGLNGKCGLQIPQDPSQAFHFLCDTYPSFFMPFRQPKSTLPWLVRAGVELPLLLRIGLMERFNKVVDMDLLDVLKDAKCPTTVRARILAATVPSNATPALLVVGATKDGEAFNQLAAHIRMLVDGTSRTIEFVPAVAFDTADDADILCLYAFDCPTPVDVAADLCRYINRRMASRQMTILFSEHIQDIFNIVPFTKHWLDHKSDSSFFICE